ncbi:class I SAM-dependent methyltransferase [Flavobacterium album]|uniref:Class I SAM-dependent methyltransferase n=1 Tax=Flavobacterium album TaxID=2175091 RepID=A0A2S1R1I0_9FLAO|nr:class I SAM-dependent methyltransferase [Flavobacterium album]AWH86436.1 class I SAM-dependent methyltransferase [Flavobacterium album]
MQTARSFYNRITFLYPVINVFLAGQRKVLIREVNKCPPGTLLEIGVGTGSHLPMYVCHDITGIDISEAMLNRGKRFESSTIKLMVMDGEDLSFPDASFEYVVMSHVLAVAKDPDRLLEQVHRVLKPGGKLFILNHFTPDNGLQYIDRAFHPVSSLFHFKSLFRWREIEGLQQFSLVKQTGLGTGSYYKLLIFSRP